MPEAVPVSMFHQKPKRGKRNPLDAIKGAHYRGALPDDFIEPCQPTDWPKTPTGPQWVHEIKADGYRCQLWISQTGVRAYTRRGVNWVSKVPEIAAAAQKLPLKEAILDGELIVPDPETGLSDFGALQNALGAVSRSKAIHFYAFDLLYLNDYDLRGARLLDRKAQLQRVMPPEPGRFIYCEHLEIDGGELFGNACRIGIEGVVSKLRDAPYKSGRTETWVKTICRQRETFAVVGFEPAAKGDDIKGAYLGREEGGQLLYAGKVEVGFSGNSGRELRARLEPLRTKKSPLSVPVSKPNALWVQPKILVDVEFRGITSEAKKLRHASFKGVRDDLMEKPVRRRR